MCWIACPEGRIARALEAVNLTERPVVVGTDLLSIREDRHSLEHVYLEPVDKGVEARKR